MERTLVLAFASRNSAKTASGVHMCVWTTHARCDETATGRTKGRKRRRGSRTRGVRKETRRKMPSPSSGVRREFCRRSIEALGGTPSRVGVTIWERERDRQTSRGVAEGTSVDERLFQANGSSGTSPRAFLVHILSYRSGACPVSVAAATPQRLSQTR